MAGPKGEPGRDGLEGMDGIIGPPGNVLIIPTSTGSKGPDTSLQVNLDLSLLQTHVYDCNKEMFSCLSLLHLIIRKWYHKLCRT